MADIWSHLLFRCPSLRRCKVDMRQELARDDLRIKMLVSDRTTSKKPNTQFLKVSKSFWHSHQILRKQKDLKRSKGQSYY